MRITRRRRRRNRQGGRASAAAARGRGRDDRSRARDSRPRRGRRSGAPVQIGARQPAVQQHHAGPSPPVVAQEQLAAAGTTDGAGRGQVEAGARGCRGRGDARTIEAPTYHQPHGCNDRIGPRQGHRRRAAAARHLVQARAPRPDDAVRAVTAPARRRCCGCCRRGVDRLRRAGPRQGRRNRAARPAPAARAVG